MANLQEVPTEELLRFQDYPTDYPTVHNIGNNTTVPFSETQIQGANLEGNFEHSAKLGGAGVVSIDNPDASTAKSFWSIEYYQQFFDVDTKDVLDRILASITPKWDNTLKHHLHSKPDLYGPIWISVTLIFTIAISGNIADYLQHANSGYRWKYDFHMVSYTATIICLYVTLIPFLLWCLLKWSVQVNDLEGVDEDIIPGTLELICVYGYSLFIYIPVSILWSIQISFLQWALVLLATFISGSVLLLTLMPALRLSRHKFLLSMGIVVCHLLLAAGFMLYFFHDYTTTTVINTVTNKPLIVAKVLANSVTPNSTVTQVANKI